jgi:hypothetical protein
MESESEPVSIFADIKITVDPANLDEEQFASLWNVASATMGGDLAATRELASKFLGFLCKKRCPFIVVSATDATYLLKAKKSTCSRSMPLFHSRYSPSISLRRNSSPWSITTRAVRCAKNGFKMIGSWVR